VSFHGLDGQAQRARQTLTSGQPCGKSARHLDVSAYHFPVLRNRLCIVFCGDKSPKLVALTVQVTAHYCCQVRITMLDALQSGDVFAVAALLAIKWPGWKWVAGFSKLVAQRNADAMRAVQ
jgi:hypothetical protein